MDDQRQLSLIDEETPNLKVVKANALVEAQYELTGKAHKLVLVAMAQIRKDQTQLFEQVFAVPDLVRLIGASETSSYTDLNRIAKDLMKRQVEIRNDETGEFELYQWVTKAWCKKGHFGIRFSEDLKPFLIGLVGKYTLYELGAILRMTSNYAIRLFELLKQYEGLKSRTFSLDPEMTKSHPAWENFPKLMGYDNRTGSYTRFNNVKQRVLTPAIKQVQDFTEFKQVDFKVIRFQRKAVAIQFTWETRSTLEHVPNHPLYPELLGLGVSQDTIRKIFTDYDEDRIARNLSYVKKKHKDGSIKNPPAYLMDALAADYVEPELNFSSATRTIKDVTPAPVAPKGSQTGNPKPDIAHSHPLFKSCGDLNEFKLLVEAERERGEPFDCYNDFHQYQLDKKFRRT
ncbi:replication initiation protein [Marinobacter sp. F3R08]|uniref:replication initiation protein n=1 Tax=Marinobacter sp. F3R08 TaxID=2841559 RepID=UPI001E5CAE3D|nr:replication initiation protein [Marinobacter sp. F3R08]